MTILCNVRDCYFNKDRGFCTYDYLQIRDGVCSWVNNPTRNYREPPSEEIKITLDDTNIKQIESKPEKKSKGGKKSGKEKK